MDSGELPPLGEGQPPEQRAPSPLPGCSYSADAEKKPEPKEELTHDPPVQQAEEVAKVSSIFPSTFDKIALVKMMECIRCFKITHPNSLYTCSNSHLICSPCLRQNEFIYGHCFEMNKKGEYCTGKISQHVNPIYNLVFNKLKFKCPFLQFGCKESISGSDVENHQDICKFRPNMRCPFKDCKSAITKTVCSDHIKNNHTIDKFEIILGNGTPVRVSVQAMDKVYHRIGNREYYWVSAILTCSGSDSGLEFMLMAEETLCEYRFWISLLPPSGEDGNEENAKSSSSGRRFLWTIAPVTLPNRPGKLTGAGAIFPFSGDFADVKKEAEYMAIPKEALPKNYIFKKGDKEFLDVDVNIKAIR